MANGGPGLAAAAGPCLDSRPGLRPIAPPHRLGQTARMSESTANAPNSGNYGPFLIKLAIVCAVVLVGGFILQTVTTGPESCNVQSFNLEGSVPAVGELQRGQNGDVIWEATRVTPLADGSYEVCGRIPGIFKRL